MKYASIIIDDPLLRENYGFLNYRKLLKLADQHNFHATVAFIPWNFDRTDDKIAALFRDRPDRLSLCVHGCDHTKGEFGSTNRVFLDHIIDLATARMQEHERLTGIPFERVMVFPQGVFSNESLEALKRHGYLAAINTEIEPVEGSLSKSLPFFQRWKFSEIDDHNPAFIMTHHDDFKDGYRELTATVDRLNAQGVLWGNVGDAVKKYTKETPVDYRNQSVISLYGSGLKIALRRYASEFMDNYLSQNDTLLSVAKSVKGLFSH
jgi:peptidoglycan/xylan/chitin deacetylase (PgdA/CDA1 family)